MREVEVSKILGYSVSAITTSVGILVLSGLIVEEAVPPQLRIILGLVLLLLGIYRFVMTRTQIRQSGRFDE